MSYHRNPAACLCLFLLWVVAAEKEVAKRVPAFSSGTNVGDVKSHFITEASGLAASRKHPGVLYTHNDHGGHKGIFMISATGHRLGTLNLVGIDEHDFEDIALGKCTDQATSDYCIYIGDVGDEGGHGAANTLYRIPEPDVLDDADITIDSSNILLFSWAEPDCETLMVDPAANVFIISRTSGGHGAIAQVPKLAWGTGIRVQLSTTARLSMTSHGRDPVSGDISPDGSEVLIKFKDAIYYWDADGSRDYLALLQTPGKAVPYIHERQGEAVCWDATGRGYYTLSEGANEPLYHYVR